MAHSKLQGTRHQKQLAEEDILHIKGAIQELEAHFHLQHSEAAAERSSENRFLGVDSRGAIPWHPNGAPFELTAAKVNTHSKCSTLCNYSCSHCVS